MKAILLAKSSMKATLRAKLSMKATLLAKPSRIEKLEGHSAGEAESGGLKATQLTKSSMQGVILK